MNVANFPNFYSIQERLAQKTTPIGQLASMLNDEVSDNSPLEAAKRALLAIKDRLDDHRDEQIENALDGYRALRSRQTSYESGLEVQQGWSKNFQTLNGRRNEITDELSAARADYETYTATEATLDVTQRNKLSLRVSSLENELASVNHDISAIVEQANRYANSQRQYADYLESTSQGGYAAYEYQNQPEYTEGNFLSETSSMIDRMKAGAKQWRDRVSSYCEQYGMTPYDFESYIQERQKLADAYFAAQQRVSELLYATKGMTVEEKAKQVESTQGNITPVKDTFDTVEISDSALTHFRRIQTQDGDAVEIIP